MPIIIYFKRQDGKHMLAERKYSKLQRLWRQSQQQSWVQSVPLQQLQSRPSPSSSQSSSQPSSQPRIQPVPFTLSSPQTSQSQQRKQPSWPPRRPCPTPTSCSLINLAYTFLLVYIHPINQIYIKLISKKEMLQIKKGTNDKIHVKKIPLQKRQFYQISKLTDIQANQVIYYMYEFNNQKMKQFGMENSIANNRTIFNRSRCRELEPGWNVHYIKREKDNCFFVEPYQCRLDQYARKNWGLTEEESVSCLRQIINAIYSLHQQRYACLNLRAQNFVLVQTQRQDNQDQKKKTVLIKINSVPFKSKKKQVNKQIDSPFAWKLKYQSPESYTDQLSAEELDQSIVWNIGCIWLELLYGRHLLTDLDIIDKFCRGNATDGKFNFAVLKLQKKLSNKNYELLKNLLAYNSKSRMTLKQVFTHDILGHQINSLTRKKQISFDASTVSLNSPFIMRSDQSELSEFIRYDSLTEFAEKIIKIVEKKDFLVLIEEKAAYKQILSQTNSIQIEGDKPQAYSPKNTKKSKYAESKFQNIISASKLLDYLRPYKFYYDKIIFMSNCLAQVKAKLKSQIQNSHENYLDPEKLRVQQPQDLLFKFQFSIVYLKLIYLKTIYRSIQIYQNVFNIPNYVYSLRNSEYENQNPVWQLFQQTAMYSALSQFYRQEFAICQNSFIEMINKYEDTSNNSKLSGSCLAQIKRICEKKKYKVCPIQEFLSDYQKSLKEVLFKVDHNSHMINGLKMPAQDQKIKRENTVNAAYLQICVFIQSQLLFSPQKRQNLFYRYMKIDQEKQSSDFLIIDRSSFQSRQQKLVNFCGQNSKQYFDFESYENFLKKGKYQNVENQVNHLFCKFKV